MKKILLVIADASRVLFYLAHGPHNVVQLSDIENKAGNTADHEKAVFAKVVVTELDKIMESQHLKDLCIFAPPKFMGLINKDHLKKHINITEVTREVVHLHAKDLEKLIQEAGLNFMPG